MNRISETYSPLVRSLVESLEGALLGTAIGDALGLPAEGLSAETIARRFGALDRFSLVGRTGFVSDDTEQSFLVLQSLIDARSEAEVVRRFRRSLVGWFWRFPFGLGLATLRACVRATFGFSRSGVDSAGNGAAMRAPILGVATRHRPRAEVIALATALARVTHIDRRAVDGAVFATLVARGLCSGGLIEDVAREALSAVSAPELRAALSTALASGRSGTPLDECARTLGTSGFVLHSLPWALCCAVRHHDQPMSAVRATISAGGDTDTNAAIVGAWLGAMHGPTVWPVTLINTLANGPFGVEHARQLALAASDQVRAPAYIWPLAMLRNLALYPVVLAHGFRRLWPFG